jgi:uncharacterized protein YehS (DUF1456 family)
MLSENDIYKKICIALDLSDKDCMQIFKLGGINATRAMCGRARNHHTHRNFKRLDDYELNCFLQGLIAYKRGENANN